MNTKQWTPVLIVSLLAFGSAQAFADSGWHYDEDSDTVIFSYNGSPVISSTSQLEDDVMEHTGAWNYDEYTDTIVIHSKGSRSNYARTNPSIETPQIDFDMAYLD